MNIALVAFTPKGWALAKRITLALKEDAIDCFNDQESSLKDWVKKAFSSYEALCFVGATGIAVRLTAPLLQGKDQDPAILVLDENGQFVIPLLSGHIGGANRLARKLAAALEATAVITTATDVNGLWAVDEWSTLCGCALSDIRHIKDVSAALLKGEPVGFYSDLPVEGILPFGLMPKESLQYSACKVGVCLSLSEEKKPFPSTLNIIPKIVSLGAGCRKNTTQEALENFILNTLKAQDISLKALNSLSSIDLKQDEPCFLAFAKKYELPFTTFSAETLRKIKGKFSSSAFVQSTTGVDNVCERAAFAAGGQHLLLSKTTSNGMSMALAASPWTCRF